MLKDGGFDLPSLLRHGGALTDNTGLLNIKVKLANPHVRGFTDGWLESVDYGFREVQQARSVAFGITASVNQGTSNVAGSLDPNPPGAVNSNTHPHQTVSHSLTSPPAPTTTPTLIP